MYRLSASAVDFWLGGRVGALVDTVVVILLQQFKMDSLNHFGYKALAVLQAAPFQSLAQLLRTVSHMAAIFN
jgi:hypothetical protein